MQTLLGAFCTCTVKCYLCRISVTIYFAEPFLCTDDQINAQFFTDIVCDKDFVLKNLRHNALGSRLILIKKCCTTRIKISMSCKILLSSVFWQYVSLVWKINPFVNVKRQSFTLSVLKLSLGYVKKCTDISLTCP